MASSKANGAKLVRLKTAGRIVAHVIRAMRAHVRPGMTTGELDRIGGRVFARAGARSGPQLDYGFPRKAPAAAGAPRTAAQTAAPINLLSNGRLRLEDRFDRHPGRVDLDAVPRWCDQERGCDRAQAFSCGNRWLDGKQVED